VNSLGVIQLFDIFVANLTKTYMIKHLKELSTGLMYGADYGASALRQRLENGNTLEARCTVESTETNTGTETIGW